MDRLSAMRMFVAVVDAGGFSAAARVLSIPLATVSRKIMELERNLGVQLLVRSTRKVTVTDSGQRYYEDVRRILDDIDDAERLATGEYQKPTGHLTVTAPTLFGRHHVLPIVIDFMQAHEDITIELRLTNNVVDLLEENLDLAIRIGTLSNSSMIAVEAGRVRQVVCASPNYFLAQGRPRAPGDLFKHRCISYPHSDQFSKWAFRMASGKVQRFPVRTKLTLNSIEGKVQAALQDAGLVQLYSYQAAVNINKGTLETVLEDFEIYPQPVNLLYPQGRRIAQKLRTFLDYALPRLRERLADIDVQCSARSSPEVRNPTSMSPR